MPWIQKGLALCLVTFVACHSAAPTVGVSDALNGASPCQVTPPSYAKNIAPTIKRRCLSCHADGGEAAEDHDFSTFQRVRSQRQLIDAKVRAFAMPPAGEAPLTAPERSELLGWIACQAPNN